MRSRVSIRNFWRAVALSIFLGSVNWYTCLTASAASSRADASLSLSGVFASSATCAGIPQRATMPARQRAVYAPLENPIMKMRSSGRHNWMSAA